MVAGEGSLGDELLDPDGATRYLAAWQGRVETLAASTQAMSDQLRDLRIRARDPNRLVEVTLDASGGLVDLQFGDRIRQVSPEVLARTVLDTVRTAKRQLTERSQEIIAGTMGPGSPTGRAVADRLDHWPWP